MGSLWNGPSVKKNGDKKQDVNKNSGLEMTGQARIETYIMLNSHNSLSPNATFPTTNPNGLP